MKGPRVATWIRGLVGGRAKQTSMDLWISSLIRSQHERVISPKGDLLPRFPEEQLQISTTGLAGRDAIKQASFFYEDAINGIARCGDSIAEGWKLLDFGSGWGRITRVAMRDFKLPNIVGIDVDESFVKLSNDLFSSPIFKVCASRPPVDIDANSLNLVLAYSVFSHLSEEVAGEWIAEFSRILKKGGYVAFTTRSISFVNYCEHLAKNRDGIVDQSYQKKLAELFSGGEAERCRQAYAEGQFIYKGIGGGGVRDASFYGEAFIPAGWIERKFGSTFEIVTAEYRPERYDQFCFVLKKN